MGVINSTGMVRLHSSLTVTNNNNSSNLHTETTVMVSTTQASMDVPRRTLHRMGSLLRLTREGRLMGSRKLLRRRPQSGKPQLPRMVKCIITTKEPALLNGILRQICRARQVDCCLWDVVRSFDSLHVFLSFLFFVVEVTL